MICGIGTDIAKVSRFKKWIDNPEMINHFFNEKEVKYCRSPKAAAILYTGVFFQNKRNETQKASLGDGGRE